MKPSKDSESTIADYSPGRIAPDGQVSAHVPQSTHKSGLITYLPSPSEIALTGQPPAHVPHEMQESFIANAIVVSSFNIISSNQFGVYYTPVGLANTNLI